MMMIETAHRPVQRDEASERLRFPGYATAPLFSDDLARLMRSEAGLGSHEAVAFHTHEWMEVYEDTVWLGTVEWKTYHLTGGGKIVLIALPDEGVVAKVSDARAFRLLDDLARPMSLMDAILLSCREALRAPAQPLVEREVVVL